MSGKAVLLALAVASLTLGDVAEQPVGLVMSAGTGKLLRVHTETLVAARVGDLLFSGDVLKTETGPSSFLYCPTKQTTTIAPASEVTLGDKALKFKTGKVTAEKPVGSCFLPQTVRVAVASQQHYGVSLTRGTPEATAPIARVKLAADVAAEVAPLDAAIKADPNDQASHIGLAVIFDKYKLYQNAKEEYKLVGAQWPDAVWVKGKIFELDEKIALGQPPAPLEGGKTYALLVGISKYQKLEKTLWLNFAHADALTMEEHFKSPRGGGLSPENLVVLTDEKATTGAVRNAFETFLKARAGKNDTVFILIAGHGIVEAPGSKKAYIVTHDSDPQDLASTALPMAALQKLVEQDLSKVGRVVLFVDVCRAGAIGTLRNDTVNSDVEKLSATEGEMLMLLASRPKEVSLEGQEFGGGHGAFSYALLKGLNGAADENKDGVVDASELIEFVKDSVKITTKNKQHPRDAGTMGNTVPLADVKKPGIEVARWPMLYDSRSGEPIRFASTAEPEAPLSAELGRDIAAFNEALAAGHLLPDDPNNAFAALKAMDKRLTPERYFRFENQLRVALEDRAQQVLLAYLAGDQTPPTVKDFQDGARYTKAASLLTPESLHLQARQAFFDGRATVFEKDYPRATERLEQAVRIDPAGAYSYNALGIVYLEQADFQRAVAAFRDAARRAPHWSYPLHNLAVASVEMGDFKTAIRSYQEAMHQTPNYFYLPYNLGLLYQRMNRNKDAEGAYRKAISLAPEAPEPYNALGSLRAFEHKRTDAEKLYNQALQKKPGMVQARHNKALLLLESQDRQAEALTLLQENLKDNPEFLASRLTLAESYNKRGETENAIREYRQIVTEKPAYTAAREALGDLLAKSGDIPGALAELKASGAQNPALVEKIADLEARAGNKTEAQRLYDTLLQTSQDRSTRKRIREKKAKP